MSLGRRVQLIFATALVAAALTPTSARAERTAYVSNGLAGSQNISMLRINPTTGALSPLIGSPRPTGGTTIEGIALTPDAKNLYLASFGTQDVRAYNVLSTGALTTVTGSPYGAASTPLGVSPSPDNSRIFVWNHGSTVGV